MGDVTADQACENIDLAAEHLDTLLKQAAQMSVPGTGQTGRRADDAASFRIEEGPPSQR
jgi:hypothetical protein